MKALKTLKVAVISLLLFFITSASAQNFILNGDNYIIDERLKVKLTEIASELKSKTKINIHIYVKSSFGIPKEKTIREKIQIIKQNEQKLIKTLDKPYAVLMLSLEDTYSNVLMTKDLEEILDKDEILDDYVIPVLASKDKNQLYSKASAAILNGYSQMAEVIAKSQGIEKLDSNIETSGKTFGTIWKIFMYTLVVGSILLYTYAVMKRRK